MTISGWAHRNASRRGISHISAKASTATSLSAPAFASARNRSAVSSRAATVSLTSPRNACPRTLRARPCDWRSNSATPRYCSSFLTRWATAPDVTPSSRAARAKLWCRAATSKKRIASSGARPAALPIVLAPSPAASSCAEPLPRGPPGAGSASIQPEFRSRDQRPQSIAEYRKNFAPCRLSLLPDAMPCPAAHATARVSPGSASPALSGASTPSRTARSRPPGAPAPAPG